MDEGVGELTTQHISRSQWAQIEARVRRVGFEFDPGWKCLIDGLGYGKCLEHDEADQADIIQQVRARLNVNASPL